MKRYLALATVTAIGLAACAPEAEDKVENAYEERADELNAKADQIEAEADKKADKLEAKADKLDDMSDKMGDMVESGTLDKSEAMPSEVVGNEKNKLEEVVSE